MNTSADPTGPPPSRRRSGTGPLDRRFLAAALRDFRTTGAIAPSGRRLAATLTEPVRVAGAHPLNVLEVGAGSGAVTTTLLPLLPDGSRLDIVEPNGRFAPRLHEAARAHPVPGGTVLVHEATIEEVAAAHQYDVIVSGLPFANFSPDTVRSIMDRYFELLRPHGLLRYFAYVGTRGTRALVSSRAAAARHDAVQQALDDYHERYATGSWTVWSNLPPARVWQLRAPGSGTATDVGADVDADAR